MSFHSAPYGAPFPPLDEMQRAATLIREYAANVHGREKLHGAADAMEAAVNHLRPAKK